MKRLLLVLTCLLLPAAAQAQVIANPTSVTFNSPDHTTVIPAGDTGAGSPTVTDYQGYIFPAVGDPAITPPLVTGAKIPKATAALVTAGPPADYRLTFAQMGLTIPACAALPCPQYRLLIESSRTNPAGVSARTVAGESAPFTAALPALIPPPAPVGTSNLRLN